MKLSDLLLIMIFLAVILYRVYKSQKEKKASKKDKQLDVIDVNHKAVSENADSSPLHRIYVQSVDYDKAESPNMVANRVTQEVTGYLEGIDNNNALRPYDIGFFTSYNRIFIVYKW